MGMAANPLEPIRLVEFSPAGLIEVACQRAKAAVRWHARVISTRLEEPQFLIVYAEIP
jgi:hypothetical protein